MNMAENFIDVIHELEPVYCQHCNHKTLADLLYDLEKRYRKPEKIRVRSLETGVIKPDRNYLVNLINAVKRLITTTKSINYELNALLRKLEDILRSDDFDDSEDIMNQVHRFIEKYIYGSDTKVSQDEWKHLDEFLKFAGYSPINVSPGDKIDHFKSFFERPIAASGGESQTIKHIQLKPYTLRFYDDDEKIIHLNLCGKCTYYR